MSTSAPAPLTRTVVGALTVYAALCLFGVVYVWGTVLLGVGGTASVAATALTVVLVATMVWVWARPHRAVPVVAAVLVASSLTAVLARTAGVGPDHVGGLVVTLLPLPALAVVARTWSRWANARR